MLLPSNYELLAHQLSEHKLLFDEPLSSHTYFKLGGPADLFFEAKSVEELTLAVSMAVASKFPYFSWVVVPISSSQIEGFEV